jgi:Bacterial nucleoid DNA-binding protein
MSVLYVVRKKTFRIKGILKSLYFLVPKSLQKKGVNESQLANELSELSSLSSGDVVSVLKLLSKQIVKHIKNGRTVTINGLGTFYLAISRAVQNLPKNVHQRKYDRTAFVSAQMMKLKSKCVIATSNGCPDLFFEIKK